MSDFIIVIDPLLGILRSSICWFLEGGVLEDCTDIWSYDSLRLDLSLDGPCSPSIFVKLGDYFDIMLGK